MRTVSARTQSTQTSRRSGDDRPAPETSCLNPCQPRQPTFPRRSRSPGWMRWSPEDGEGGLRRVLLPRPLVRRKATIKSTSAMRYSALEKTQTNDQRITPIPYKITKDISRTQFDKPTASQSTCPQVHRSRAARYRMPRHPRTCRAIS